MRAIVIVTVVACVATGVRRRRCSCAGPLKPSLPANTDSSWAATSDHIKQSFEVHVHRTPVALPDRTEITAASFDPTDPYTRAEVPDYGLYLDRRWQPPWSHDHVAWPDFGVPADPGELVTSLKSLLTRAREGQRVEIGCVGGHGRTGTALACLAVLTGQRQADAVSWVRANYCPAAVETEGQQAFVQHLLP